MALLDGGWIAPDRLQEAVAAVKFAARPIVLVLSEADFLRLVNAVTLHGQATYVKTEYAKLGISKVIWAEDLTDGQFVLAPAKNAPPEVETLTFK